MVEFNEFRDISAEQHESNMRASRLGHDVLQTVINHAKDNDISKEEIVAGLLEITGYWQKKILRDKVVAEHREADDVGERTEK